MRARTVCGAVVVALARPALATPPTPATPPPIKVAVLTSVAVNLDAAQADAITTDLAEALGEELVVDAVGGLAARRQLAPDVQTPECQTTPACATAVAKTLGVQQLLFVTLVGSGEALQVDAAWVDGASGRRETRAPIDVAVARESKARFRAVAHGLVPDAALRPKPVGGGGATTIRTTINGAMTPAVPHHFTTASYATAAGALVGVAVGIGFGLHTRSRYDACDASRSCSSSTKDGIRLTGLVADGAFVVAIGGAIATGILYATSSEAAHFVVAPTGGGGGVAIGWTGRF